MRLVAPLIVTFLCQTAPICATEPAKDARGALEAYGESQESCIEWSDGCGVCLRGENGAIGCCLPGIACEPEATTCKVIGGTRPVTVPSPE